MNRAREREEKEEEKSKERTKQATCNIYMHVLTYAQADQAAGKTDMEGENKKVLSRSKD